MKKLVPFIKTINLDTNVDEVTSISLDKKVNDVSFNEINGEFELYLEYKESDVSIDVLEYKTVIPFDVDVDEKYSLDNATIDIDDFYYELEDNNIVLHIDLIVDNIEYSDNEIEMPEVNEDLEEDYVKIPIYQSFDPETEDYVTYNVHIVRENDNIDSICLKYGVTKDDLSYYNDVNNIKLGDKLIVPTYKK